MLMYCISAGYIYTLSHGRCICFFSLGFISKFATEKFKHLKLIIL